MIAFSADCSNGPIEQTNPRMTVDERAKLVERTRAEIDHPVTDAVWTLFERAIENLGPVSTLIEWDDQIPPYARLVEEADKARRILERVANEKEAVHGPS